MRYSSHGVSATSSSEKLIEDSLLYLVVQDSKVKFWFHHFGYRWCDQINITILLDAGDAGDVLSR